MEYCLCIYQIESGLDLEMLFTVALEEENEIKEESYLMPKGSASSIRDPFKISLSFLKTPPSNTKQPKSSNNIWAPILHVEPKLHPCWRKAFEFIWKNLTGSLNPKPYWC